ncbi:MAG: hypothetical protein WA821_21960 [Anaerolineales bacterium]
MPQELFLNGIDATTGGPLDDFPVTTEIIAKVARGQRITPEDLRDAKIKNSLGESAHFGVAEGIDVSDLSQTGWGVIFPASLPQPSVDAIKDALKPLLDLRKKQASAADPTFYKEFIGADNGYKNGESKNDFLKRFGRGPGPADPAGGVPYYLLIVGSPETIPYTFQYQLDVQYGVGRIYFEKLEDYARYANSVVQAETQKFARAKKAAFFGTSNPGDRATSMSAMQLIKPLAAQMTSQYKDWAVEVVDPANATKANLSNYMGGKNAPSLLFTASHGMSFRTDDARQLRHQGALICQDWPGPAARIPIDDKLYFSADDIPADADVFGMFAFIFACYGGGTPKADNFYRQAFGAQKNIAPYAFMSQLPLKLLAHPKGGALGVFAHVERAWGSSIVWDGATADIETFDSTVDALLNGKPAGAATEYFNQRYAEISTMLTEELDNTSSDNQDDVKLAGMWTSNNDARNYAFIGDPAVRLAVGATPTPQAARDSLGAIVTKAVPAVTGAFQPDIVNRAPAAPVAAPVAPATNYGIGDLFKKDDEKVEVAPTDGGNDSLKKFADKLGEYLAKALDDATSLEVFTYAAEDMQNVAYENGKFSGGAQLRAMTRISIDGDTLVCVPEKDGEVDTAVWNIHLEMVRQAQASRAELLKTLVSAATGIVNLVK